MKFFSNFLILLGIFFCIVGLYYLWLKYDPNALKFENYKQQNVSEAKLNENPMSPTRVIIKDLGINTQLIPTKIEDNKWSTTTLGASYVVSSPIPGEVGNSIIYAHNWRNLFGNLNKALPGQIVEVEYADMSKKQFIIEYTSIVSSSESSVLEESKDKRITLYTCTGFLDLKRFVAVAVLKEHTSTPI